MPMPGRIQLKGDKKVFHLNNNDHFIIPLRG